MKKGNTSGDRKGDDTLELLVLVNHLNAMFVMLLTEGSFAHGGEMAVHHGNAQQLPEIG